MKKILPIPLSYSYRIASGILESIKNLIPHSSARISSDSMKFWNCAESEKLRDLSHWLGEGRWADQNAWFKIGQEHLRMFEELSASSGFTAQIDNIVEWGPGGGANAIHLYPFVKNYYGIDISEDNLSECQRQLKIRNYNRFNPILIDIDNPEYCINSIHTKVEFFISTAVYQHFPSKQYGQRITSLAYRLLANGGIALIQIRYDDGTRKFVSKRRDYSKNVVSFTSYYIDEFWDITKNVGFDPFCIKLKPEINYAYFLLRKS